MQPSTTISPTITPAKAQKVLADNGLPVSIEMAADILNFLTKLAESALQHEDSIPLHTSKHRRAS